MKGKVWMVVFVTGLEVIMICSVQVSADLRGCVKLNGTVEYNTSLYTTTSFDIVKASEMIDILIPKLNNHLDFDCSTLYINYTKIYLNTSDPYVQFTTTFKVTSTYLPDNEKDIHSCLSSSNVFTACSIVIDNCFSSIDGNSATKFSTDSYKQLPCCREAGCPKDDCSPVPCANGGNCSDIGDDFQCTCVSGWEGRFCNQSISIPQVIVTPTEVIPTEGNNVTFKCVATGTPTPTIKWFLVSEHLIPVAGIERHHVVNGILNIRNIMESDSGTKYICYAFNKHGNSSQTAIIKSVMAKPRVSVTPHILNATEGSKAQFQCDVTGHPMPVITWFVMIGQDFRDVSLMKRYVIVESKLIILNITKKDRGETYLCVAKNKLGHSKDVGKVAYIYEKDHCSTHRCRKGFVCTNLPDGGYECSPPENQRTPLCIDESRSPLYLCIGILLCIVIVQFAVLIGRYIYSRRILPRNSRNNAGPDPQLMESTVTFRRVPPSGGLALEHECANIRNYSQLQPTEPPPIYASLQPRAFQTGCDNEGFYSEINSPNHHARNVSNMNSDLTHRLPQGGQRQLSHDSMQSLPNSVYDSCSLQEVSGAHQLVHASLDSYSGRNSDGGRNVNTVSSTGKFEDNVSHN